MTPATTERLARLAPPQRRTVRIIGILLLVAGAALLSLSFATFLRIAAAQRATGGPMEGVTALAIYLIVGAVLIVTGVFFLRLGHLKPLPLEDEDPDPATLRPGAGRDTALETPRLLCAACGHLEREGARHCSACGAPL